MADDTLSWSEVVTSKDFLSLPGEEQEIARSQYFESVVKPMVPAEDLPTAQEQFDDYSGGTLQALRAKQEVDPSVYETKLDGMEEADFQNWKKVAPGGLNPNTHDLRGIFKESIKEQAPKDPLLKHAHDTIVSGKAGGPGGAVHSGSVEDERLNGGKITLIPFTWDGKLLEPDKAIERAVASGNKWPTFNSHEEATDHSKRLSESLTEYAKELQGRQKQLANRFEKPNSPTFNTESIYAEQRPDLAGKWDGDAFDPPSVTGSKWIRKSKDVALAGAAGLTGLAKATMEVVDMGNWVARNTPGKVVTKALLKKAGFGNLVDGYDDAQEGVEATGEELVQRPVLDLLTRFQTAMHEEMSPEMKESKRKTNQILESDDHFASRMARSAAQILSDPELTANVIAESGAFTYGGAKIIGAVSKVAYDNAMKASIKAAMQNRVPYPEAIAAAKTAAKVAATEAAVIGSVWYNSAGEGGMAADQARQEVMGSPDSAFIGTPEYERIMGSPAARRMLDDKERAEKMKQVKAAVADRAAKVAFATAAPIAGLSTKLTRGGIDVPLFGKGAGTRQAVRGIPAEMIEETGQGAGGQLAQNVAMQQTVAPEQDLEAGVDVAMGQGAAAGLAFAAPGAAYVAGRDALTGRKAEEPPPSWAVPPGPQSPPPPPGPGAPPGGTSTTPRPPAEPPASGVAVTETPVPDSPAPELPPDEKAELAQARDLSRASNEADAALEQARRTGSVKEKAEAEVAAATATVALAQHFRTRAERLGRDTTAYDEEIAAQQQIIDRFKPKPATVVSEVPVAEMPQEVNVAPQQDSAQAAISEKAPFDEAKVEALAMPAWASPEVRNKLREALDLDVAGTSVDFPQWNEMTREQRAELVARGFTPDVDRMGKPRIKVRDSVRADALRQVVTTKQKAKAATQPAPSAPATADEEKARKKAELKVQQSARAKNRQAERRKPKTDDDLITLIAKWGGWDYEDAMAHGLEPDDANRGPRGLPGANFLNKTGKARMRMGTIAEKMFEFGFDVRHDQDIGSGVDDNKALELVMRALAGETIYSPDGAALRAAEGDGRYEDSEYDDAPAGDGRVIADAYEAATEMGLTEAEVNALADKAEQEEWERDDIIAAAQETIEERGAADREIDLEETAGVRQEAKVEEAPLLETVTPEELRRRDEVKQAAADEEAAADQKAQADKERDSFALAGSDREADQAAAAGQEDLQAPKPATKPDESMVGKMVTFKTPGPNGPMKMMGSVERIMPDGKLEVRARGGIYKIDPSEAVERDEKKAAASAGVEQARILFASVSPHGRIWDLAGSRNAKVRAQIMSLLLGRKATQAESGVTALEKAFREASGVPDDEFMEWLNPAQAQRERELSMQTNTRLAAAKDAEKSAVREAQWRRLFKSDADRAEAIAEMSSADVEDHLKRIAGLPDGVAPASLIKALATQAEVADAAEKKEADRKESERQAQEKADAEEAKRKAEEETAEGRRKKADNKVDKLLANPALDKITVKVKIVTDGNRGGSVDENARAALQDAEQRLTLLEQIKGCLRA